MIQAEVQFGPYDFKSSNLVPWFGLSLKSGNLKVSSWCLIPMVLFLFYCVLNPNKLNIVTQIENFHVKKFINVVTVGTICIGAKLKPLKP